ncbi:KRAB [Mytilus coruscus]|uniref:KRAB n=1 Tax=Mytilus coruscus TaxID=42192 RepID=A0A6J8CQT7_MYTCO|nr:KRAB [Mytilus coruscus]
MDTKTQCGIGRFTPDCMQCFTKVKIFTVFYSISTLLTSTLSVYIASQITTLEKQFGLTSTQSGFLLSCNDIGYLAVTLFVSYFAEKVHPPRVLSFSTMLFGAAGLICAIPYFISPMHSKTLLAKTSNFSKSSNSFAMGMLSGQLCQASSAFMQSNSEMNCSSNTNSQTSIGLANDFTPVAMAIIAIGMIVQGIAKSPRQAFVTTYIDNNVDKTKTAVYVGGITAFAIFGPALAFGLGGLFSRIYVTLEGNVLLKGLPKSTKVQFDICSKIIERRWLPRHLRTHGDQMICSHCPAKFADRWALKDHEARHSDPLMCDVCGKKYTTRIGLSRHMRDNASSRPIECDICHQRFNDQVQFEGHRNSKHLNYKPFKCTVCNKVFAYRQSMTRHAKICQGNKSYNCVEYNAVFNSKCSLDQQHNGKHGQKEYTCMCGKSFRSIRSFTRHSRICKK